MPRNASGVYTLPEASFVAGTTIQSAPMNSNLSDLASAMTLSVATTGVSTLTGPLRAASGSVTAPSYTFGSATGTGFYLSGTDQISWTAAGVLQATFASTGAVTWAGAQTFSSTVTFNSTVIFSSTITTGAQSIVTGDEPALTLNNTDNDAFEHEIQRYALGSGAGTTASRRAIGAGANDISEIRDYIGSTNVTKIGATYFKPMKNVIVDDNSVIVLATAGYVDAVEIVAPSAPVANTGRLYVKDLAGATIWAYQDSAATETILTPPARAYAEYALATSLSGSIPQDTSIPQSGEGDQILTAAITLKKSNSRVRVTFQGWVSRDAEDTNHVTAVFSDLSTNALNVTMVGNSNDTGTTRTQMIHLQVEHAPATVGPITYQIRCGTNGGNYAFNSFPTATLLFGGSSKATLVVEEIYV